MAQALVTHRSNRMAWIGALALAVSSGGAWVWWTHHNQATAGAPPIAAVKTAASAAASAAASGAAIPADTAQLVAQQQAAAQAIEHTPAIAPVTGPVTQRPAFVSELEWQMLKGVAQQHPQPAEQLTRLVNKLRFAKQLELWQGMDRATDPAKRRVLAEELLSDLPRGLAEGDIDLPQARQYQADLLPDVVPDPVQRKVRAEQEAKRLVKPAGQP